MSELIKAIISVKGPFSLMAFVSVVLLVAFRTKTVPGLVFGLLKDKLTKDKFSHLLNRFLVLGFAAFVLLCVLAALGQILAYKVEARAISSEDFRAEIQSLKSAPNQNQEAVQQAITAYEEGIGHLDRKEFDQAINSLQDSINKIPTLSAEYTIAYLYEQIGDDENAKKHAREASLLAQTRGSSLDVARVDKLSKEIQLRSDMPLVGAKSELPPGGDSFETATPISPDFYLHDKNFGKSESNHYFKVALETDQLLIIRFRTSEYGGGAIPIARPKIYDKDGAKLAEGEAWGSTVKSNLKWKASKSGTYYLNLTADVPGTVYLISIQ